MVERHRVARSIRAGGVRAARGVIGVARGGLEPARGGGGGGRSELAWGSLGIGRGAVSAAGRGTARPGGRAVVEEARAIGDGCKGSRHQVTLLNTPTTRPRIRTSLERMGSISSFSGCRRTWSDSRKKRLTV